MCVCVYVCVCVFVFEAVPANFSGPFLHSPKFIAPDAGKEHFSVQGMEMQS